MLLLTSCSASLYNSILSESNIRQITDVAYGELPRHRLNVYHPEPYSEQSGDVIIFFHGGAWNSGNKDMYYFVARSLVDRGYIVVIPNYRLHPNVGFPAFLEDSARAVAWTLRNLSDYVSQSNNYYLMGHSAGAYNAAMLTYNENYLSKVGASNEQIQGFIGLAGLYNFLPITDPTIKPIFEGAEDPDRTQPIHFVERNDPPALLVTGKADERVNPQNSQDLNRALRNIGVKSELVLLKETGHVDVVLSLGPYFRSDYSTLDKIDTFVTETRKVRGRSNAD